MRLGGIIGKLGQWERYSQGGRERERKIFGAWGLEGAGRRIPLARPGEDDG